MQLLQTPWPSDCLPPSTASLLDVSSGKGLVAAAGPDTVIIARTSTVQAACKAKTEATGGIFQPEVKLTVPRISQLAFSADENVLVISAESGGGLAAYQVDSVMKGEMSPALQLQTKGNALRALVANPAVEKAAFFAAVAVNGQLLVADLESASLLNEPNGSVLKEGVSCVAWSKRGKQLIAGLADCTACQMTPDGVVKAVIPRPPSLPEGMHISRICWLEDNIFLNFYSETNGSNCEAFIIQREKGTANFEFQKLPEIVGPFGMDRTPPYQFVGRLREFPPSLSDLLLVAFTCGSDIGLVTKSDRPLSEQEPVTGYYTTTLIDKDNKKAALPFSSNTDTSPIGMAIDLSSTSVVLKPLENLEEMDVSDSPVPVLLVLNNEGVLCAWHVIYTDSIMQKKPYPFLTAVGGGSNQQKEPQSPTANSTATISTDAHSGLGPQGLSQPAQTSAFGQPIQQSPFSKPSQPSGFGQPAFGQSSLGTQKPAFGGSAFGGTGGTSFASNTIEGVKPSWVSTGISSNTTGQTPSSGFGKPGFGSPSPLGAAGSSFGTSTSKFGSPAFGKPAVSASQAQNNVTGFGQSAFGQSRPQTSTGGSGGFSSFANGSGFSGFTNTKPSAESPFGSKLSGAPPFGQSTTRNFSSMDMDTPSAFGTPENKGPEKKSGFGSFGAPGDFSLGSTFKSDSQYDRASPKPTPDVGFSFGKGFGDTLEESQRSTSHAQNKDENMDEADDSAGNSDQPSANPEQKNTTTPPSTVIHKKPNAPPTLGNLFGTQSRTDGTPASVTNSQPTWTFGPTVSTTPKDPPKPSNLTNTTPPTPPKIKTESPSDDDTHTPLRQIPEAPLPPESTSKISYTPGDTSTSSRGSHKSSSADDASSAPDFTKATKKITDDTPLPPDWTKATGSTDNDAPLPPDFTEIGKSTKDHSPPAPATQASARDVPDAASLPPDFTKSDEPTPRIPSQQQLPTGSDDLDSTGSWEDGPDEDTEGPEPSEGPESPDRTEDVTGEHTEDLKTSPESSFAKDDESTGGPFTKISHQSNKPNRLFGEVGKGVPVFLPPRKGPESPRSPSPTRNVLPLNDSLRPDTSRSVSAPSRPHAALANRRAELQSHALPQQAPRSIAQIYSEDQRKAHLKAEASPRPKSPELTDDDDEQLRSDLAQPVTPTDRLDDFLPHQPPVNTKPASGIPAQIECLFHDINSMIGTLGLNARALSAFVLHQETHVDEYHQSEDTWRHLLYSGDQKEMIEDNWTFADIPQLHFGETILEEMLEDVHVEEPFSKLDVCQDLLCNDIGQLQRKLASIRKALHAATNTEWTASVPLSAEQSALQQSLRKESVTVETKLAEAERSMSVLRAKLAEATPAQENGAVNSAAGRSGSQRKPTVEAVTSTIKKMTSMAERKSSDIAVLEAQLRKLNIDLASPANRSRDTSLEPESTTPHTRNSRLRGSLLGKDVVTPSSIYHTPESKFGASTAGMRSAMRVSTNNTKVMAVAEDKEQWREKTKRKKAVNALLREALLARRSKGKEIPTVAGWNKFATAVQK